jgi:predicted PurR-regulated permease PerM
MVVFMIVLFLGPTALLASSLADSVTSAVSATRNMLDTMRSLVDGGSAEPPAWLGEAPVFGPWLDAQWRDLASGGQEAAVMARRLLDPAGDLLLMAGRAVGRGLVQMGFAVFIGFFLYRDGNVLAAQLRAWLEKLAGPLGGELLDTTHGTVASIVQGLFGAALAQALVALIGFLIAGVPGAFLLASGTFLLSFIPIGPPLLWGGASLWLLHEGSWGRALFLAVWGLAAISSIDNLVRPYLISRGSRHSLLLIVLGVFGGVAAFGFIGIFIGPPILAVGQALLRRWMAQAEE